MEHHAHGLLPVNNSLRGTNSLLHIQANIPEAEDLVTPRISPRASPRSSAKTDKPLHLESYYLT